MLCPGACQSVNLGPRLLLSLSHKLVTSASGLGAIHPAPHCSTPDDYHLEQRTMSWVNRASSACTSWPSTRISLILLGVRAPELQRTTQYTGPAEAFDVGENSKAANKVRSRPNFLGPRDLFPRDLFALVNSALWIHGRRAVDGRLLRQCGRPPWALWVLCLPPSSQRVHVHVHTHRFLNFDVARRRPVAVWVIDERTRGAAGGPPGLTLREVAWKNSA
ncbi:hypothetical protein B0H15DRAFT_830901 [Mycena belliarum]|uniref:Uncharacterized protein n=1 Tax=Mycena belliarum TaxID=1033014 RepID=A0AAD6UD98_9AGAR|nr:hypothetical protein B0H15DRAFT_830901 [Mycena belliae]